MSTEDLIRRLAAAPAAAPLNSRAIPGLALAGLALAAVPMLWALGLRPDLAAILVQPLLLAKSLLPLLLALPAGAAALRRARPGAPPASGLIWPGGVLAPLLAAALWLWALAVTPQADWGGALIGKTLPQCLAAIVTLSALPLAISLFALRRGASTTPHLSGALAGLACGGLATAAYALHCTEDHPLFYITWYGCGIGLSAGLGALAGGRLLRW